jgi:hypothetical protein
LTTRCRGPVRHEATAPLASAAPEVKKAGNRLRPRHDLNAEFPVIAKRSDAMRFLGTCLSHDDTGAASAALQDQLTGGRIDWLVVLDLANRNWVTPALAVAMRRKKLFDLLPEDLKQYLAMIHELNCQRNRQIGQQAAELVTGLNRHGIRPLLLKGAISLFEAGFEEGLFVMADVDLLLNDQEIPPAATILRTLGYSTFGEEPHHAHAETFHRPMSTISIDLHWDLGPQRRLLSSAMAQEAAVDLSGNGLDLTGLCPTHRVLLLLMSFSIFDPQYRNREIPLRGLHNLAAICNRHRIDWEAVAEAVSNHGLEGPAQAWLHMASCLLQVPVPQALHHSDTARRHLRRCLRRLNYPRSAGALGYLGLAIWAFNPFRMDYRYGCGLRGWPLNSARSRHAIGILARHSRRFTRRSRGLVPPQ